MKREAHDCTKMRRLCRRLDIPTWQAVGLLESIWWLTARQAPRGDIGKISDEDIALGIDYRGDEATLIRVLVDTGWLDESTDHRLIVHDWSEHADWAVHMRLARACLFFADGKAPKWSKLTGESRKQAEGFYCGKPPDDPDELAASNRQQPVEIIRPVSAQKQVKTRAVRTNANGVRTHSAQNGAILALPEPEPEPEPEKHSGVRSQLREHTAIDSPPPPSLQSLRDGIKTAAAARSMNGNGRSHPEATAAVMAYEQTREWLVSYPGAQRLPGKPDDQIVKQCLELAGGDIKTLASGLKAMNQHGKAPAISWAYFPNVLRQYIGAA